MADEVAAAEAVAGENESDALVSSIQSVMGPGDEVDAVVEAKDDGKKEAEPEAETEEPDEDALPKTLTDDAKERINKRIGHYVGKAKEAASARVEAESKVAAAEERAAKAESAIAAQAASRIKDAEVPIDYFNEEEAQTVSEYQEVAGVLRWAKANRDTGAEVTDPKTGAITTYTADQIQAQLANIEERYTNAAIDARPILRRAKGELSADLAAARATRMQRAKAKVSTPVPAATTAKTKVATPPPSRPAGASGAVKPSGKGASALRDFRKDGGKNYTEVDALEDIAALMPG